MNMVYKFSDMMNNLILNSTSVMIVTGPYSIFNNIVIDKLKQIAKGSEEDELEETYNIMSEFSRSSDNSSNALALSFNEFMENVVTPAINGKWFCSVDYDVLNKKQIEQLENYIKKPSEYGILVVEIREWKEFRSYLRNKILVSNKVSHLIQLSFPSRGILREIVKEKFKSKQFSVEDRAIDLFIMRMSTAYDEYDATIDDICITDGTCSIDYSSMLEHLKNVNNYVLDDFIAQLMIPVKSKKIVARRKIYKMYGFLRETMTSVKLVNALKYKVNDMLELRMHINNGNIPVLVKYGVDSVKERLPEDSRLRKMNAYTFKRSAYIASRTTLKDWYYMKVILNSVSNNECSCDRVLIGLMHRSAYNCGRLTDLIGINNILDESLYGLNGILFHRKE